MTMFGGKANNEQYPHVRAMRTCLACGGMKHQGLLVCWNCHNELKMQHDIGYGPTMDRVLIKANEQVAKRERDNDLTNS